MPGEGQINSQLARAQTKRAKKVTPAKQYAALPVPQRQAQLASKGVLKPAAAKTIKQVHAKRVTQLKTSPAARQRLANRQLSQALAESAKTISAAKVTPVQPGLVKPSTGERSARPGDKITTGINRPLGKRWAAVGGAGGDNLPTPLKVLRNAAKEAVDIPVNTVPALYHLGSMAAHGHVKEAGKALVAPTVEVAKHGFQAATGHPAALKKDLTEHPLGTLLTFAGAEGAIGGLAGKAARRGVAGKAGKEWASTKRASRTVPGARAAEDRQYSANPLKKQRQILVERHVTPKVQKVLGQTPGQMTAHAIRRRVNEDVAQAKTIAQHNAATAHKAATEAIGKKPTAAVTLAAQGITDVTHKDLSAYLAELKQRATGLAGDELHANELAQKQITHALEHHDQASVQKAVDAYTKHRAVQEADVAALGIVKPTAAEEARLAPIAVRRLGATSEAKRTARVATKQQRVVAERAKKTAAKDLAKAEQGLQHARANARVSVATRKKSPTLAAAEKVRNQAVRDVARLQNSLRGKPYAVRVNSAEKLAMAREKAQVANRAVAAEHARLRGVAPAEHEALLRAIAAKEQATLVRKATVVASHAATGRNRAIKKAPFVSAAGEPLTIAQIRGAHTGPEPAFVSHANVDVRTKALPVKPPSIPVREQRAGEAVRLGTLPTHPSVLVRQSMNTQALIDAARARERFVEDWGHRPDPTSDVGTYGTEKIAQNAARATVNRDTGVRWSAVKRQDGQWALVPSDALAQVAKHEAAKGAPAPLRAFTGRWRRTVLGFSPRWLAGNTIEGALRSVVAGATPWHYAQAKRLLAEYEKEHGAQAAAELRARILPGGQYRSTEPLPEPPGSRELGRVAEAFAKLGQKPGPRQIAGLYGKYTDLVFHTLNGRMETQFQTAMLGKALRKSPLMREHTGRLSEQAFIDAAKGLKDTNAQNALAREVDRMYGQYGKYSPEVQAAIAGYTPFIAWSLNATNFLFNVLPRDHPVLTSLLVSANQATEKWRSEHSLVADFTHKLPMPGFLMGSIPGKDGSHLRLSRYTPFGLLAGEGASPLNALSGAVLPQLTEVLHNVGGQNWQGRQLSKDGGSGLRNALAAAVTLIESQVPLAKQAADISGVRLPNMADTTKIEGSVGKRARKTFDPFMYTPSKTGGQSQTPAGFIPIDTGSVSNLPFIPIAP